MEQDSDEEDAVQEMFTVELVECIAIPWFFAWLRDTVPAHGDGPVLVPELAAVTMTNVRDVVQRWYWAWTTSCIGIFCSGGSVEDV